MTLHAQEQSLDTELTAERDPPGHRPAPRCAGCGNAPRPLFATGDKVAGDAYTAETARPHMARRVAELADDPTTPLFFGRLDFGRRPDHAGRATTSAGGTSPTRRASRWCWTGGPRSPARSTGPAPATRRACAVRRRFGFSSGDADQLRGRAPGPGRGAGHGQPDPHRRDRAPARRADAGHRRHHPARAGRAGPRRPGRLDLRPGRAGHRQDRRRAAPGRVPALPAPGAAAPLGRADRRAEPGLPVVHRGGAAGARRGRGRSRPRWRT